MELFPIIPSPASIVLNKDVSKNTQSNDDDVYDEDEQSNRGWSRDGTQDGDLGDILDLLPTLPQFSIPILKHINKESDIRKNNKDSGEFEDKDEVEPIADSNADIPIVKERVVSKDANEIKVQKTENIKPKTWYEQDGGVDSKEDEEDNDNISQSSCCSCFSTLNFKACDIYFPIPGIWIVVSDYGEDKDVVGANLKITKEREPNGFSVKDHELETLSLNSGPCNFYFPIPRIWIRVSVYEDELCRVEVAKAEDTKGVETVGEDLKEYGCNMEGGGNEDAVAFVTELSQEAFTQDIVPLKEHLIYDLGTNTDVIPSILSPESFIPSPNVSSDLTNTEDELYDDEDEDVYRTTLSTIDLLGLFPSVPPIIIIKPKSVESVDVDERITTWGCETCETLAYGEATFGFDQDICHNPWACRDSPEGIRKESCAVLDVKRIDLGKGELEDERFRIRGLDCKREHKRHHNIQSFFVEFSLYFPFPFYFFNDP